MVNGSTLSETKQKIKWEAEIFRCVSWEGGNSKNRNKVLTCTAYVKHVFLKNICTRCEPFSQIFYKDFPKGLDHLIYMLLLTCIYGYRHK